LVRLRAAFVLSSIELPLDHHLLPLGGRLLPSGDRRLPVEGPVQLLLQFVALLLEVSLLLGIAGGDHLDALPQAVFLVGESVVLCL
jgi:hypothetical protein